MSQKQALAAGSNRRFHHTETTTATRPAIWARWSDPATWGDWDKGLKAAAIDGPFGVGASGWITPLKGPKAAFLIEEMDPEVSYTFATSMPGAKLRVRREFVATASGETVFRHIVWFDGAMAWLFSRLYGKQFRRALPPTMQALAVLAEVDR